jgi:HlyD family secretion protein
MRSQSVRTLMLVLCAGVLASVGTAGLASGQTATKDKGSPSRGVAALGRLEPAGGIVHVSAPSTPDAVSGSIVAKLHVSRGSDVQAGQLLAEMDSGPVGKARIAEADADLETARREARSAASLADEACVLAAVAARQSTRKTELKAKGLASIEETEVAKGAAEAGAASCKARKAAAAVAESGIASAQALLAQRKAEYERTLVRAPVAGRVLDLKAKPGETVGPAGILELGHIEEMYAIAEVYETDIGFVKTGQRAKIHSDALSHDLQGSVVRIRPKVQKMDTIGDDPAARKDARIIEVEIKLDDSRPVANLTSLQVEVEIAR